MHPHHTDSRWCLCRFEFDAETIAMTARESSMSLVLAKSDQNHDPPKKSSSDVANAVVVVVVAAGAVGGGGVVGGGVDDADADVHAHPLTNPTTNPPIQHDRYTLSAHEPKTDKRHDDYDNLSQQS